jgi:hypothetical protein
VVEGNGERPREQLADPPLQLADPIRGLPCRRGVDEEVAIAELNFLRGGRRSGQGGGDGLAPDLGRLLHLLCEEGVEVLLAFLEGDHLPANDDELALGLLDEFDESILVVEILVGVVMVDGFHIALLEEGRVGEVLLLGRLALLVGVVDVRKLYPVDRDFLGPFLDLV